MSVCWKPEWCECEACGPLVAVTDCADCGHVTEDHNDVDRGGACLVCGIDCEGYR